VAVARQDCRTLERSAHFLKGSVGNFCAQALFDQLHRLERMARAGDLAEAEAHLQPIEHGIERLKRELLAVLTEGFEPAPASTDKSQSGEAPEPAAVSFTTHHAH
jgi:HPt (histidine-containing phosphotransfer) domain-containing protein